jgi:hypothetical protein
MPDLSIETFLPHLETEFRVADPPGTEPVTLRLTEVGGLGTQPNAPRSDPFSLEFTGPSQPALDQRIYRLEHHELGTLDIFLVPIGPDPTGSPRYEAVFN